MNIPNRSSAAKTLEFASYPSLEDRHVFITGGATGIGAALVKAFFEQGCQVSFIDVDSESAIKLIEILASDKALGKYIPKFILCDVTDIDALKSSVKLASERDGLITVLINNVANDSRHSIEETSPQSWQSCMAVNLDPVFFASQSVCKDMIATGGGSIINFSSINAILGPANMPGYVAAKSAIVGLTKSFARELGEKNIRVNSILPGWVVTEKQLDKWLTPEAEAKWMEQVSLQKRIQPEDVASLALFLAAEDSSMITGQEFIIDGGLV